MFPELLKKHRTTDIITVKIADDQTAKVLQQYIGGYFGTPGLPDTDKDAIDKLLPNRLQDQFCFRTEDALLLFAGSRIYDALFDFDTGIWKESPEYLLDLYNKFADKKSA